MVKHNIKRTFAVLAIFVVTVCVFAAFCGTTSHALFDYGYGTEVKHEDKVMGTGAVHAVLADYDNCLTDYEEDQLLSMLYDSAKSMNCNIGVVITRELDGMNDEQYTRNFSQVNFGTTSDAVVLLLFNSYNVPEYNWETDWIYASGKEYSKFDDRTTDKVFDRIYDKMGDPHGDKYAYNTSTKTYGGYDYYSAVKEFATCVKRYGATGAAAIPYFFLNYITYNFTYFFGGLIISIIVTLIIVSSKVRSYKRKATLSAANYMDRNATRVTRQVDNFIREYTTSHTHSSSSGGHGGGGHHGGGGGGGRHR